MQTDAVRVHGLSRDLNQEITKFDSSEFDDDKEVQGTDAEGVWSPDIEQSFQEALAIYPPCGRRKIILSDEGKMYGRNELIARYIKLRTGKTRTRKQVSSHIQVLARRKLREIQAKLKVPGNGSPSHFLDQAHKEKALQSMQQMSSAQIVSASAMHHPKHAHPAAAALPLPPGVPSPAVTYGTNFWSSQFQPTHQDVKPFTQSPFLSDKPISSPSSMHQSGLGGSVTNVTSNCGTQLNTIGGINAAAVAGLTAAAAAGVNSAVGGGVGPAAGSGGGLVPPAWLGRTIGTPKLRLLEYSAYVEQQRDADSYHKHLFVDIGGPVSASDPTLEPIDVRQIQDKFPEKKGGLKELYERGPQDAFFLVKFWADLNTNISDDAGSYYNVTAAYESNENMTIQVSTKVCSFSKQVVEKLETEYPRFENGRYLYKIARSPMCEYMVNFIHKLKHLPEKYMMNSVLENFTILQVISNRDTQETLLCVAFVFEVSTSEHGAQHHIYKLVKD